MGTLFGVLSNALGSLLAQQEALEVTSNNIANANTPGYSRQRVDFTERDPVTIGSLVFGQGVTLDHIESVRDQVLELRIQQEMQNQGQLDSFLGGMNQVAALFNETQGVGLENVLGQFFNSLQALSTDPTNLNLRQAVLNAGQALANAFHQTTGNLSQIRASLDSSAVATVTQVNQLTSQIAALNGQITGMQASGQNAGQFIDQRDQLIEQLSNSIGVSVINANNGTVTLTTSGGAALVVGNQSLNLQTQTDPATGMHQIMAQGTNITADITGGELGGLLQARDQAVPAVQASLDNLAASLTSSFNAQHAQGFDLSGAQGGNFFVPSGPSASGSNAGAAAHFAVAITDPSKIAASGDGTAGNNANILALAAIRNQSVVSGQSVTSFYANLVAGIGAQVSATTDQQQAEQLVVQQLQAQRQSVSGVSLDEEAANLVKYQQAYDAEARVLNIVDQITQVAISLGSTS